jgi:hypothetical protein
MLWAKAAAVSVMAITAISNSVAARSGLNPSRMKPPAHDPMSSDEPIERAQIKVGGNQLPCHPPKQQSDDIGRHRRVHGRVCARLPHGYDSRVPPTSMPVSRTLSCQLLRTRVADRVADMRAPSRFGPSIDLALHRSAPWQAVIAVMAVATHVPVANNRSSKSPGRRSKMTRVSVSRRPGGYPVNAKRSPSEIEPPNFMPTSVASD